MTVDTATQITLYGPGLRVGQPFDISISIDTHVGVDAATARKVVAGWLVSRVGNLLAGDETTLVIGRRTVWRVPALRTSPSRGIVGQGGAVVVDAETGVLLADAALALELRDSARRLARTASSPAT